MTALIATCRFHLAEWERHRRNGAVEGREHEKAYKRLQKTIEEESGYIYHA